MKKQPNLPSAQEVLRGTLDMLILQTLRAEPMHGWGISEKIRERSKEILQVNQGALYPALHRLEKQGLIESHMGRSENNRRAKFYQLTGTGETRLRDEAEGWRRFTGAVNAILAES